MLALDLFVLGGNKAHRVSVKEAGSWVAAWVTMAFTFAALLWWYVDANDFLPAAMAERFHLLKYGLALVLVFIGGKMLMAPWFHMPVQWLAMVGSVILVSVLLSLKFSARKLDRPAT